MKKMNEILLRFLWGQLQFIGLFTGRKFGVTDLKRAGVIRPLYDDWLEESIAILTRHHYLSDDRGSYTVIDPTQVDREALWREWEDNKGFWLEDPRTRGRVALAEAVLRALPEVLTGKILATTTIFPGSSTRLVEGVYKNNPVADYFSEILAETVAVYIEERLSQEPAARIRIIELGAGTGGTSTLVFKKLQPYRERIQEYCYTDISKAFLFHGENEYGRDNPFLTYRIFDVEAPLAGQNIAAGGYDLVIAANVLHATRNIRQTLRNVKTTLKRNGLLLLNEISKKSLFTHLTFGLLEGWWRYEDVGLRIPGCPGLAPQTWQMVLETEGFESVFFPARENHDLGQQVVVAASNGIVRQKPENGSFANAPKPDIKPKSRRIAVQTNQPPAPQAQSVETPQPNLGQPIVTGPMIEDYVKTTLREKLAVSLKVDLTLIDDDEAFSDYGVDSIVGVRLVQIINQALTIELDITSIFDYSTVNRLTTHIVAHYKAEIGQYLERNLTVHQREEPQTVTDQPPVYPAAASSQRFRPDWFGNLGNPGRTAPFKRGETSGKEPIAIIGMSGRFAKSETVEELWQHLAQGDDLVGAITRWDLSSYYSNGSHYCNYGSFLANIDRFDPLFFKISGTEAAYMDPGQRLILEEAWKALEDAGYAGSELTDCSCGVYVGYGSGDYQQMFDYGNRNIPAQSFWGNAGSVAPARIAYYLDLNGPAIAVDTACSSSLVSLHLACQGLWAGETDLALAGGVFVQSTPRFYLAANRADMLSGTGRCHTFDQRADGFVPGEGVGVVVLKRLTEALEAGDHLYGVVRGSGINQDGATNGITAPSAKSQERLERRVYDTFQIDPGQIQMVEAHGTGTILGDPLEYQALTRAFRYYTDRREYCAIGSIKTNIGHTVTAAGIAGLIKILLALKYKQIPPSLHFEQGNSHINFEESPFYVNTKLREWPPGPGGRRCAAVSSFGFSGTNAHVVIEEAPQLNRVHTVKPGYLIAISAYSFQQLQQQVERLVTYCKQTPEADCGNISFTLVMGRKHLNHRLACVVANRDDLISALGKWPDQSPPARIYQADLDEKKHQESAIQKRYGNQCIRDCQNAADSGEYLELLSAVAELYVKGYDLEFSGLFSNDGYCRVSLPTYPFAKELFWLPETASPGNGNIEGNKPGLKPNSRLHPLIDSNVSTLDEVKFLVRLTGKEFFLADHQINGRRIFPGVAYIEMVRAAGTAAAGRPIRRISNLTWLKPVLMSDCERELYVGLAPHGAAGQIDFQVSSRDGEGQKVLHAQGVLRYENPEGLQSDDERADLKAIQQRCSRPSEADSCYEHYRKKGLQLGPAFRVIRELHVGDSEVLALLQLPAELETDFHNYRLHPAILDGSLQAAIGLTLAKDESDVLNIPFTMGEVEIRAPLRPRCYAHLVISGNRNPQTDELTGPKIVIRIIDETGKVLVKINDFVARPFLTDPAGPGEGSKPMGAESQSRLGYYHPVWERSEIDDISGEISGPVLIFDHHSNLFEAVKARLVNNRTQAPDGQSPSTPGVFLIKPGEAFQALGNGIYRIKPGSVPDYQRLFQEILLQGVIRIIHNWSAGWITGEKQTEIEAGLEIGFYSLFDLCRTLSEVTLKSRTKLEISYLFPGSAAESFPHFAAVSGFAKALALENNRFDLKTLELERESFRASDPLSNAIPDLIWNEMRAGNARGSEIRYRGGQRWVKTWRPFQPLGAQAHREISKSLLKERGVYLITGGLGGLGMIFARYLARELRARLILTGRSALDEAGAVSLRELEALGAEVIYIQADVSRREAVQQLLTETKARFQSLNGIIHSAGLTRDALIVKKKRAEIGEVLAPKVYGTIYLDEATRDEELDFMVLFSSLAAVFGNTGQSDYAYANSFLDYYAERRQILSRQKQRSGRTLAIHWPLWRDGGLRVAAPVREYFKNTMGLELLDEADGVQSFKEILASAASRVMVLPGGANQLEHLLLANPPAPTSPLRAEPNSGRKQAAANDITGIVQRDLVQIVAAIAKIDTKRIGVGRKLTDYGFDSLILVDLANRINQKFRLQLSPAVFFEYSSIESFTRHLIEEYQAAIERHYAGSQSPDAGIAPEINLPDRLDRGRWETELPRVASSFENRAGGIERSAKPAPSASPLEAEPVAIIGMHGVMPQSDDLEEFWTNLEAKRDLVTPVPEERWVKGRFKEALTAENDPDRELWGGFMREVDKFDAAFFGISPREAEMMDPQQRIMLETVWKTIEDAGYRSSDLWGSKTGLFIGVSTSDYYEIIRQAGGKVEAHLTTGLSHAVLANRISFFFNFHGPSLPIDTACSSALIALHQAVEAIRGGSCELAIAGGVNVLLTPNVFISFGKAGMLSPDGRCKTFDKRANGYVRGEGAGAVLLKPLRRAVADGDHIYAVIKASVVNHGGNASSLTVPSMLAQSDLLIEAYEKAGMDPATIGYIEAHGTGTGLGDPIEVDGLKRAFTELFKRRGAIPQKGYCGIGSVKTNAGHLEAAAGISGLLKVLLALRHQQIPASLHFQELNPYIQLEESPFEVVRETRAWDCFRNKENQPIPRRAGISSFGFGGANAHVVLEEYPDPFPADSTETATPQIIVLSARNEARLKDYADKLRQFIERNQAFLEEAKLRSMAFTLQVGREPMEKRLAIIASNLREVRDALIRYCREETDNPNCYAGPAEDRAPVAEFFEDTLESREYLNIVIREQKLEKLAKIWVLGVNFNWELLYRGRFPRRISLPTYPFARDSYWVEGNPTMNFQAEVGEQMVPEPETHPSKSWREIIRAVAAEKRRDALEAFLKEQLTEVLRLAPGQRLDTNQPLVTLGLDSLMALQLKKQIENRMALDVSVIQFLGRESLDDLVNMLFLNLAEGQDGAVRTVAGEAVAKREELPNDVIEGVI